MAIDFDTTRLPSGDVGWARLLAAVEAAHPHDENEWIEFKAGVDPASKPGAAAIAKAVTAFANRDPDIARRWFDGFGVVLVGIAPGDVPGVTPIDPAVLHDKVSVLLKEPAPHWDVKVLTHDGKTVLAVLVDPPNPGDPIACIGKAAPGIDDGDIYVRKVGKSDRAKGADIRRLETRVANSTQTLDGITVTATGTVPRVHFDSDWAANWLRAEESRLLNSLSRPTTKPPITDAGLGKYERMNLSMLASFTKDHDEDRTEEQFREEVDTYLNECRGLLPHAFADAMASHAANIEFTVTNNDSVNYENLRIEFHVEGDVYAYTDPGDFEELNDFLPKPPRQYGYWTSNTIGGIDTSAFDFRPRAISPVSVSQRPTIINGGSATIKSIPMHLRPHATDPLDTGVLVARDTVTGSIRVTWKATATNRDGLLTGELTLTATDNVTSLRPLLAHTHVIP